MGSLVLRWVPEPTVLAPETFPLVLPLMTNSNWVSQRTGCLIQTRTKSAKVLANSSWMDERTHFLFFTSTFVLISALSL